MKGERMERKADVSIAEDSLGRKIVVIHEIRFKGKRKIDWNNVEQYLKQYIGKSRENADTGDLIYIGRDFPNEYSGSQDTARLKGALAKAKANAALAVEWLIENAAGKRYKENLAEKHAVNARYGWYRLHSRFALPVFMENGEIERYNTFCIEILIRHAADGKMYLYDMVNVKKETSTPFQP